MKIKVNGREGFKPYMPTSTVLQSLVVTRPEVDAEEKKAADVAATTATTATTEATEVVKAVEETSKEVSSDAEETEETAKAASPAGLRKRKTPTKADQQKDCSGEM